MSERPFTVDSLAERWSVTSQTVYAMIRRGELRAFRAGKSPLRIAAGEVQRHEQGCGDLSSTEALGMPLAARAEQPNESRSVPRIVRPLAVR
jgi:excisionase family DNA binding protein